MVLYYKYIIYICYNTIVVLALELKLLTTVLHYMHLCYNVKCCKGMLPVACTTKWKLVGMHDIVTIFSTHANAYKCQATHAAVVISL